MENESKKIPEISVIIPCYNAEKTIVTALESLSEQTFKNFEVIIVDDGSIDGSVKIIEQFMESKRLQIRLLRQANRGVSCARNLGLKNAEGELLSFLDADDAYLPEFLEELYHEIKKNRVDLSFCSYMFTAMNHEPAERVCREKKHKIVQLNKYEMLDTYLHHRIKHINFVGGLYKKSLLEKYNIYFPEEIRYGEDSQFFCTYLFYCKEGGIFIEKPMYQYMVNPSSATNKITYEHVENIEANKNIASLWKQDPLADETIGELLISRAVWSAAKSFSIWGRKDYRKLMEEYDVKRAMKIMSRKGDEISIRVSSFFYLLSPQLFKWLIRIYCYASNMISNGLGILDRGVR